MLDIIVNLFSSTEIVTTLMALGPVGYSLIALLSIATAYFTWMAKKNNHDTARHEATNASAEVAREAQDRLRDTNAAGDEFLDS